MSALVQSFGGSVEREPFIQAYIHGKSRDPTFEARLCDLLGMKTEEEKRVEAAQVSAQSARSSATTARVALGISLLALIVSIIALVLRAGSAPP